jgi:hypothetical protein
MSLIELTEEEREVLTATLQRTLTTAEIDFHRADSIDSRKQLKHRCEMLKALLVKSSGRPVAGAV